MSPSYLIVDGQPARFPSNKPTVWKWTEKIASLLNVPDGVPTNSLRYVTALDGSTWVARTRLELDKLTLLIDITKEHLLSNFAPSYFWQGYVANTVPAAIKQAADLGFQTLSSKDKGMKIAGGGHAFKLDAGPRGATAFFQISKPTKKQPMPQLRIELNPRKIGPDGFQEIYARLEKALSGDASCRAGEPDGRCN